VLPLADDADCLGARQKARRLETDDTTTRERRPLHRARVAF